MVEIPFKIVFLLGISDFASLTLCLSSEAQILFMVVGSFVSPVDAPSAPFLMIRRGYRGRKPGCRVS